MVYYQKIRKYKILDFEKCPAQATQRLVYFAKTGACAFLININLKSSIYNQNETRGIFFQQKKSYFDNLSIYIVYTKKLFSCIYIKKIYTKMEKHWYIMRLYGNSSLLRILQFLYLLMDDGIILKGLCMELLQYVLLLMLPLLHELDYGSMQQ